MSGFEIVSVIAAVPAVVQLATESIKLIRGCASNSSLLKVIRAELRQELNALNGLLKAAIIATNKGGLRLFRRAMLTFNGYENEFKEQMQQIEHFKTLLTLTLTDTHAASQKASRRAQLKAILQPCTASFIPPKLPGTCEWFPSHPYVIRWMESQEADASTRGLCIYGVKGCGKSVLASNLDLDLSHDKMTLAFFSFWAQSESQRRFTNMLSTLAWNLLLHLSDESFDEIASTIVRFSDISAANLLEFNSNIITTLGHQVTLVIDGLDESVEEWNSTTEGGLELILDLLNAHPSLRVLLLGRESDTRGCLKVFTGIEITEDLVQGDMKMLISSELKHIPNLNPNLQNQIETVLMDKSTVMFLWVKLTFKELRRCFSAAEIKSTLDSLPRSLEAEYHRLFLQLASRLGCSSISSQPSIGARRARRLLQLILGAAEPLTLDELRHAYAVSSSSEADWRDYLLSDDGIIHSCGDFIHLSENRVYLSHASIGDFLTRDLPMWETTPDIEIFHINRKENHRFLATICMQYLEIVEWDHFAISVPSKPIDSLATRFPFLIYAAEQLIGHFFDSEPASHGLVEPMKEFVESSQFCNWMECWIERVLAAEVMEDWSRGLGTVECLLDLTQLARWYNSNSDEISQDPFSNRLEREAARREAAHGLNDVKTQSWKWKHARESAFEDSKATHNYEPPSFQERKTLSSGEENWN
ncbi:hypothetical protein G7Z17_g2979 [Cylindrodendrum hubeiense]|uniref:Nephrocystin 3-like N-terminal domain-containing protein n=1 Tax=Cylindrodendrum hubeiense TaxID=595255 RepID=A0A9P5HFK3_9HYPO|nr:hypothetical protein G7Z17_g2979 [Cylindrodendrum hubeiense]